MSQGSRIWGLRADMDDGENAPVARADDESWIDSPIVEDWVEDQPEPSMTGRVVGVALVLASLAWVGAMIWFARGSFPMAPVALAEFVAALCVPPLLAATLYLLTMRTSRAEAHRFGATARAMRAEAASLDTTLSALSQRIEANRRALSEQANSLVAIGDAASERLRSISGELSAEARVLETIGGSLVKSAETTEASLSVVFNSLPRAQAETAGMAAALNAAGLAASEKAAELGGHLATLADRGRVADEVASGAAARLAAHIERMDSTSEVAAARLDGAASEMSAAVDAVLDRAAQAIDEARKGIAAQGDAMLAMLGASQAAIERASHEGADALQQRLEDVEAVVGRITARLGEEQRHTDTLFAALSVGVEGAADQLQRLHVDGMSKSQELAASISALSGSTGAMTETLRIGESTARTLIATAEELLTALDASAREIDETLPEALGRLDANIAASRTLVGTAKPELLALVTAAESTHDAVNAVAGLVTAEREKLAEITATLTEALDTGHDKAATMDVVVDQAIAKARSFAEDAAPQLIDALSRIRETATRAAESARDVLTDVIPDAAGTIEAASADAVRRAFARALPQPLGELTQASESAVAAATRASERLAQQLMTISQTTAEVEARIDAERADRESANTDNFARRVSLLIESLNSASIDISKTFSHEVSDSAWAAYLKGDRGVFTRRAVRLLDAGEAREIARMHDADPEFRAQVNRYIHDFEAMLRQILALRDGSPLGVTLLSSDMGKLYVALAQAIERLRT
jgi:predicted  nucleic acid-binding Zn-ribbon protein